MMFRFFSILSCALFLAAATAGCGYKIGFIKHPQLDSIAVAPVINETEIYNAASDMRMMMSEAIMQDGTYKLSDLRRADAILYITVQNIAFGEAVRATVENEVEYRPDEWRALMIVTYKLIVPGQGKPLLSGRKEGHIRFQAGADVESGRLRAVRQVSYVTAQKIIQSITEGW
ncbi:MAG: hypothetical protein IKD10_10460 [Lentisphaeria bacterium]|nr:hypothetical protein [Lentisphaerota bacterium]MBR7145352.1 hypothetical protein [Lentisphaeria bacterium]